MGLCFVSPNICINEESFCLYVNHHKFSKEIYTASRFSRKKMDYMDTTDMSTMNSFYTLAEVIFLNKRFITFGW